MDKTNNIITTDITEKELHPVTGMLMLIINIGYLLNCRVMGYATAAALYTALLSLDGVRRWLISSWIGILPCWVPVLTVLFLALAMVNLIVFEHVEMY